MVNQSESEHEEVRFRISVNMERFFNDERSRAYVSVAPRRRVRALQRRLRQLFGVPRRTALLCRGHLLPPDEPLSLLQPDDTVQVVPVQHDGDRVAEVSADCDSVDYVEPAANDMSIQCEDPSIHPVVFSSTISPDRTDSMTSVKIPEPVMLGAHNSSHVAVMCSEAEDPSPSPASSVKSSEELIESKRRALSLLEQLSAEAGGTELPAERARRRRVRRRRRAPPSNPFPEPLVEAPAAPSREPPAAPSLEPPAALSPEPPAAPLPGGVLRLNGSARAPRVVHSLADSTITA